MRGSRSVEPASRAIPMRSDITVVQERPPEGPGPPDQSMIQPTGIKGAHRPFPSGRLIEKRRAGEPPRRTARVTGGRQMGGKKANVSPSPACDWRLFATRCSRVRAGRPYSRQCITRLCSGHIAAVISARIAIAHASEASIGAAIICCASSIPQACGVWVPLRKIR